MSTALQVDPSCTAPWSPPSTTRPARPRPQANARRTRRQPPVPYSRIAMWRRSRQPGSRPLIAARVEAPTDADPDSQPEVPTSPNPGHIISSVRASHSDGLAGALGDRMRPRSCRALLAVLLVDDRPERRSVIANVGARLGWRRDHRRRSRQRPPTRSPPCGHGPRRCCHRDPTARAGGARAIAHYARAPALIIVVCSFHADPRPDTRALAAGADAYLTKPVSPATSSSPAEAQGEHPPHCRTPHGPGPDIEPDLHGTAPSLSGDRLPVTQGAPSWTVSRLRSAPRNTRVTGSPPHSRPPTPPRPPNRPARRAVRPPAPSHQHRRTAPTPGRPYQQGGWHSSRHTPHSRSDRRAQARLATDRCVAHIDALYLSPTSTWGRRPPPRPSSSTGPSLAPSTTPAATVGGPPWVGASDQPRPPRHDSTRSPQTPARSRRPDRRRTAPVRGRNPPRITKHQVHRDVWTAIPAIQAHLGLSVTATAVVDRRSFAAEAGRSVRGEGPLSGQTTIAAVADSAGADGGRPILCAAPVDLPVGAGHAPVSRNTLLTERPGYERGPRSRCGGGRQRETAERRRAPVALADTGDPGRAPVSDSYREPVVPSGPRQPGRRESRPAGEWAANLVRPGMGSGWARAVPPSSPCVASHPPRGGGSTAGGWRPHLHAGRGGSPGVAHTAHDLKPIHLDLTIDGATRSRPFQPESRAGVARC